MNIRKMIEDRIASAINKVDLEDKIEEALDEIDFVDLVNEAVENAVAEFDFENYLLREIEEMVEEEVDIEEILNSMW